MDLLTALLLTATPSPSPSGTPDPANVTAGWWAFLGLVFLAVAVFFLWRSMNTQLKRVTFDEVPVDPEPGGAASMGASSTDAPRTGTSPVDVAGPVEPPTTGTDAAPDASTSGDDSAQRPGA